MTRSIPEWIGKTDDSAIPPRVKLRIFQQFGGQCFKCTNMIVGKLLPAYDHIIPLIMGGANAEDNIQLLCTECHKVKTAVDVADKAESYRVRLKHVGIKRRKGSPMAGSKASGFKRRMDGTVVKR